MKLTANKIVVISPDAPATDVFIKTLNKELKKTNVYAEIIRIERDKNRGGNGIVPRVIQKGRKGKNVLNPNNAQIGRGLAEGALAGLKQVKKQNKNDIPVITISCNTASLSCFVEPMKKYLKGEGFVEGENYILLTTLEAIKKEYAEKIIKYKKIWNINSKNEAYSVGLPLFIGTRPVCENLPSDEFDTFYHRGEKKAQALLQELVWRTKALEGADTVTAPEELKRNIRDECLYLQKIRNLIQIFKINDINEVIVGCTDFPIMFKRMEEAEIDFEGIKFIDPVKLVTKQLAILWCQPRGLVK